MKEFNVSIMFYPYLHKMEGEPKGCGLNFQATAVNLAIALSKIILKMLGLGYVRAFTLKNIAFNFIYLFLFFICITDNKCVKSSRWI